MNFSSKLWNIFFLAALAVAANVVITGNSRAASLVGLYTFDGGNGLDASGNGNHATTVGGAVGFVGDVTNPAGGLAASFTTGSLSFIETPININPGVIGDMTMGAWVKPATLGDLDAGKVLSHDNGGFDRTLGIDFRGSNSGTGYIAFNGSGVIDSPSSALTLNQWTFLAVVYNGANSLLYYDGASRSFSDFTGGGLASLFIGTNPGFTENFVGLIDNVFVFDGALSLSELDNLRTDGFAAPVPIPAALPLFLSGLLGLGVMARRRKQKMAAA